jgi:predicted phosphodiesterase
MMPSEFSIVIIPDTQILAYKHHDMYKKMAQWIKNNKDNLNLKIVLHLGDVVHHGNRYEEQFKAAEAAFEEVYNADIPMLVTPGNHDYDNQLMEDRSLIMFNRYFGVERYRDCSWFGGTFEEGQIENSYAKLEIEGVKFLFLSLEFGPRDEVLAWADDILEAHCDYKAIIITHSFMYTHGERTKPGDRHNPKMYAGAIGCNDGEDMWHKSFKKHQNLIAIFSGHHISENISYRMDKGEKGNPIFQSFQNWQDAENGGEGRIRILKIKEEGMNLQVFNPQTEKHEEDKGYQIDIPLQSGLIKFP